MRSLLNKGFIKNKYVFILDTLLCHSDLFCYRYVFDRIGILDYRIRNDVDIVKNHLNEDNIIIFNWSSSTNYCYLNKNEVIVCPLNVKVLNQLEKKYALLAGDMDLPKNIKIPVYHYENEFHTIFNFIKQKV